VRILRGEPLQDAPTSPGIPLELPPDPQILPAPPPAAEGRPGGHAALFSPGRFV
jgi:hypothetical protein